MCGGFEMKQIIIFLLLIFLCGSVLAEESKSTPSAVDALDSKKHTLHKGQEALVPKATTPSNPTPSPIPERGTVPLPKKEPGASREPIHGHIPIDIKSPTRPSSLPSPDLKGKEGPLQSLTHILRINGRTGQVDLRGTELTNASMEWNLDAPASDRATIIVSRDASEYCPAAGTSREIARRQLQSNRSIVEFSVVSSVRGSNRGFFSDDRYEGLTDVYIQLCGIRNSSMNGVVTNIVHAQIGSTRRLVDVPVNTWSVEYSHDLRSEVNVACALGRVDSRVDAGITMDWPQVGYVSRFISGEDPFPCNQHELHEYQTSASFDLTDIPRDARIVSAELQFTEIDVEGWSSSGCTNAVRSVGLANTAIRAGYHEVENLSARADDSRSPLGSGSRRTMDVTDWVRAWQTGSRAAAVTFIGAPGRAEGDAACKSRLDIGAITVEYE